MTETESRQTVRITNIQRFCLHDGPGVRTTVFLKGCSLHCPWCANPENIRYEIQPWRDPKTCESGFYGRDIALDALLKELLKDRNFYQDGGGVTFSGGEPLLQIQRYEPLLRELRRAGIHLAVETALFVDETCVQTALSYFDWWYVDMKILAPGECARVLGGDVDAYEANLKRVCERTENVCMRIPCVEGLNDSVGSVERMARMLQKLRLECVEVFAVHDLAAKKYESLGLSLPAWAEGGARAVQRIGKELSRRGIPCQTIQI